MFPGCRDTCGSYSVQQAEPSAIKLLSCGSSGVGSTGRWPLGFIVGLKLCLLAKQLLWSFSLLKGSFFISPLLTSARSQGKCCVSVNKWIKECGLDPLNSESVMRSLLLWVGTIGIKIDWLLEAENMTEPDTASGAEQTGCFGGGP